MAVLQSLLLILGVTTVHAVTVVANEKPDKLVRREQAMKMHPSGYMESLVEEELPEVLLKDEPVASEKVITDCDKEYLLMAEGKDVCDVGGFPHRVRYEGDCKIAAAQLGLTVAAEADFFLTTHLMNPIPYPHGCYLNTTTNLVAFNPTESSAAADAIEGKKICMRTKYINGTVNSPSDTGCTGAALGASTDAVPVLTFEGCWNASLCISGGGACKLLPFLEEKTDFMDHTKPVGCYIDPIGCYGFNFLNITPDGSPIVNGTPVCLEVPAVANTAGGLLQEKLSF